MNANSDPEQIRLRAYLDDTKEHIEGIRIQDRPWALRLDVGASHSKSLLTQVADLDNYAFPIAKELQNPHLVSVWATKQRDLDQRSYVRIADAREGRPPAEMIKVRTTASVTSDAFKDEVKSAVIASGAQMLPDGPVRLELSFVIGNRTWLPVWKPTIDALDPLLGRTEPDRLYHPLDGRIVELGMHLAVDAALGYDVEIGIAPSPWYPGDRTLRRVNFGQRVTCPRCGAAPDAECPTAYGLNHPERMAALDHCRQIAGPLGFADPVSDSWPDEVLAAMYGEWPTTAPWGPEEPSVPPNFGWSLFTPTHVGDFL